MNTTVSSPNTAKVNADDARIDALKEQLRSTPSEVDYDRHIIMRDVYEETAGVNEIIRRARLIAATVESMTTSSWALLQVPSTVFTRIPNGTWNG
jgi:hypothetical protein